MREDWKVPLSSFKSLFVLQKELRDPCLHIKLFWGCRLGLPRRVKRPGWGPPGLAGRAWLGQDGLGWAGPCLVRLGQTGMSGIGSNSVMCHLS